MSELIYTRNELASAVANATEALRQQLTDAQTECTALRATEMNLRQQLAAANERIAELEAQRVPEGWKPVPVEPTDEMVRAIRFAGDTDAPPVGTKVIYGVTASPYVGETVAERMYRAMLSAAPQPAAQPEQTAPAGSGGWKAHAEDMERERNYWRSRAQAMDEHQRGQVWYWQGDGEDHLESICNSLPVVIRADALRALAASSSQTAAQPEQTAEPALAVPGGGHGPAPLWIPTQPERQPMTDGLESALEALVNRCNNDAGLANDEAVIAAEATLERVYKSRASHGITKGD